MKKIFILLSLLLVSTVNAQNIEDILSSGKEDASIYLGNYMQPIYKGLIYDLNSGWYHTGKTHKKYGFDITISASASFVPDQDKVFNFKNSDYKNLTLHNGLSSDNLPTVMGTSSDELIDVRISGGELSNPRVSSFETLDGIEDDLPVAAVPAPMIQFGLGLPSKTDLKLRYVPNVGDEEVKFNLFGIGLQHNLLQHFKIADKAPLFDLSILAAFTNAKTVYSPKDTSISVNQETIININAYTAQLVGNFDLKIINFYAGLGYTAGNASTQVKGDYTISYNELGSLTTVHLHDPIDIDYNLSGVKATLGMRLNIFWFKIFADYSIQEYKTVNAGISFSFK